VVSDGPKQKANIFFGTPIRILVDATIDGEMPERDYDLVLDIIRREVGEVGQIGSVGRTFSWSVSNQNRKMQISVMPRNGRTTVRVDEQLGNLAGGLFGGLVGGAGGGVGAAMMGIVAGRAGEPLLGLGMWAGWLATMFGTARFALRRVSESRREKLKDLARQIGDQIADSLASSEPTDPKKRLGRG
jgi:hypothetical protein